ncbi:MAG: nucleotidyltransferase family protein [Bacteroidia bacterium]|nr:nucleotidyltransferase family protein [Bacteroidia bacterium]
MPNELPIMVLAAGSSQRLGQAKQLLDLNGKTLISHIVEEALESKLGEVFVLTGFKQDLIRDELQYKSVQCLHVDHWQEGMGATISKGISIIESLDYKGVIITVCDQPNISKEIFVKISDYVGRSGKGIVFSDYGNGFGPPTYFDRKYFRALTELYGDIGAKPIILDNLKDAAGIRFSKGGIDIDTMDDYKNYLKNNI